ncbi:E3 ubiquitin-protein ligase NRDP1, partial [Asbolus verrucosus]
MWTKSWYVLYVQGYLRTLYRPLYVNMHFNGLQDNPLVQWIGRVLRLRNFDLCPVFYEIYFLGIQRNIILELCINCDNAQYGCTRVLKLDSLSSHLEDCEHNPKRPLPCELGCGLVIPKDELKDHNCVKELRALIQTQQQKLNDFQQEINEQRFLINEQKREMQLLKEFMRAMRISNPSMRAIADAMERDEVLRWSNFLQRARVTRWGGMISTPDEVLQRMIRRTLTEMGCPPHILDDLMENCHERRWPPGLSSLETRQNNRRQYENYVCKRVPGKQAVLVLACDNTHMSEDMMVEPGLVMIFAHGIE